MPKEKRGGRSLRKQPYNEYDVIGTANNGTIKVLKAKPGISNASVPLFSNTRNTVYLIAKEVSGADKVTSIAVYRNRQLTHNIDIDPVMGNHYHKWQPTTVRGKDKLLKVNGHFFDLSPAQQRLINMADKKIYLDPHHRTDVSSLKYQQKIYLFLVECLSSSFQSKYPLTLVVKSDHEKVIHQFCHLQTLYVR